MADDTGTQYAGLTPVERAAAMADGHMSTCDALTIGDCSTCWSKLGTIRRIIRAVEPVIRATVRARPSGPIYDMLTQVRDIPGGEGWYHSANGDTFVRLAARLRAHGVPDVETLDILALTYQTVADEFGG